MHSPHCRRNSIDGELPVLQPRRNSIDCATENDESEKKFENQVSDFKHRRSVGGFFFFHFCFIRIFSMTLKIGIHNYFSSFFFAFFYSSFTDILTIL